MMCQQWFACCTVCDDRHTFKTVQATRARGTERSTYMPWQRNRYLDHEEQFLHENPQYRDTVSSESSSDDTSPVISNTL